MTRPRRPDDWSKDLAGARESERALAAALSAHPRIESLEDHTAAFDRLDFSFILGRDRIYVDIKEKGQRYSAGITELWPEIHPRDLFILDETVYRRIVWQGGGGYLVVHDHPGKRWALFGPWELTLGPRVRYQRWGERGSGFFKGKLLLNLSAAAMVSTAFSVDDLLRLIGDARISTGSVAAVATKGQPIREVGR
ncbi:MAG: hypothetical protein ACRDJL_12945 [Actinomycetota bacterium]